MNWQKSSYSGGGEGDACIEIALLPTRISIRDSKTPTRTPLSFPTASFTALIEHLKNHLPDQPR